MNGLGQLANYDECKTPGPMMDRHISLHERLLDRKADLTKQLVAADEAIKYLESHGEFDAFMMALQRAGVS